jgi:hypothetical protein
VPRSGEVTPRAEATRSLALELLEKVTKPCQDIKVGSMSQEDYPIEFVLGSIEAIMPGQKQPKVLLFDIGGVCVSETSLVPR